MAGHGPRAAELRLGVAGANIGPSLAGCEQAELATGSAAAAATVTVTGSWLAWQLRPGWIGAVLAASVPVFSPSVSLGRCSDGGRI